MKKLSRPLLEEKGHTILAARNVTVDFINDLMLSKTQTDANIYEAVDRGDEKSLKNVKVQKTLALKRGCPVVLLTNLTYPLVNGLKGVVVELESTGPTVCFESVNITKKLDRFLFTVYNRDRMTNIATRQQFPLKLAYALTIHRAQGMTLDSVTVNCTGAYKPGQIAVAVGRAKTTDGLCVTNYHHSIATKPDDAILKFYRSTTTKTVPTNTPQTCCRTVATSEISGTSWEEDSQTDSDFSEFGLLELEETEKIFNSLDREYSCEVLTQPSNPQTSAASTSSATAITSTLESPPDIFKPITIVRSIQYSNPVTPAQQKINFIVNSVIENEVLFKQFSYKIWKLLTELFDKCTKSSRKGTIATKELNKFNSEVFSAIHGLTEEEFVNNLFPSYTDDEKTFTSKFVLESATCLLKWKAVSAEQATTSTEVTQKTMSSDGAGMVRYVGGMCVAKLKYKLMKEFHNSAHAKHIKKKEQAETCRKKIQLLQAMESSYAALVNDSQHPQTLVHTQRRQNERCSLTNITDPAFDFFMELENQRANTSQKQLAHRYKEQILSVITERVTGNEHVKRKFQESLGGVEGIPQDIRHQLYVSVVQKYLNVGNNSFRKELLSEFSKKKKLAHRKHITGLVTKKKAEQVTVPKASDDIAPEQSGMGPCKGKRKGKGKGKGKAAKKQKVSEKLFFCPVCGKLYEDGQHWVECTKCCEWYCRQCCSIDDQEWELVQAENHLWLCANCIKITELSG